VAKLEFLRGFLKLEHGAPSHDTFSRVFRLLDPEQFGDCFQRFMAGFSEACQGVVAIDGKVLRRSFDKASGKSALHMVSAWGCEQRLVLGQIATDAKSNEITAVPKLLKMLSLEGCTVTVDALNCQRAIAQQIVDQGGDYVLALKDNQPTLHADVKTFLDDPKSRVSMAKERTPPCPCSFPRRTTPCITRSPAFPEDRAGPRCLCADPAVPQNSAVLPPSLAPVSNHKG